MTAQNPSRCTPEHTCSHLAEHPHPSAETHGQDHDEHDAIPHGDRIDFIHEGRLHHHHEGHCDDHGPIELVA